VKLSFFPGKLFLDCDEDGTHRVTLEGKEVLRTRSQRAAAAKFQSLRKEMESRFPPHEPTQEEKAETFKRAIADSLVQHNSLGGRKKNKSAGGTRTFGG
jgi:hypothetical protein